MTALDIGPGWTFVGSVLDHILEVPVLCADRSSLIVTTVGPLLRVFVERKTIYYKTILTNN